MGSYSNLFKINKEDISKSVKWNHSKDAVRSLVAFNIKKISKTNFKITKILDCAASWLEKFELRDFISKYPRLTKTYRFFFPDAIEIVLKPQENRATKKDNIIYVRFVKK